VSSRDISSRCPGNVMAVHEQRHDPTNCSHDPRARRNGCGETTG
jgi:hypothetical protein